MAEENWLWIIPVGGIVLIGGYYLLDRFVLARQVATIPVTPSSSSPSSSSSSIRQVAPATPSYGSGGQASRSGQTYVVQAGDTLSGIAARFGVSLSALEAANPQIPNPNYIVPGETIYLPTGAATPPVQKASSGIPVGSLWKTLSSNKVYIATGDGYLHWICTPAVAQAHGISLVNIHVVETLPLPVGSNYAGCTASSGATANHTQNSNPNVLYVPSGYFYAGFHGGYPMAVPAIPHQWPSAAAIPAAGGFNCAWIKLGHPVDTRTGQSLLDYSVVASYAQNGAWTGRWAIVRANYGTQPFVAACDPSLAFFGRLV